MKFAKILSNSIRISQLKKFYKKFQNKIKFQKLNKNYLKTKLKIEFDEIERQREKLIKRKREIIFTIVIENKNNISFH